MPVACGLVEVSVLDLFLTAVMMDLYIVAGYLFDFCSIWMGIHEGSFSLCGPSGRTTYIVLCVVILLAIAGKGRCIVLVFLGRPRLSRLRGALAHDGALRWKLSS